MLTRVKEHLWLFLENAIEPEVREKIQRLDTKLNEFGVDPFGFDPEYLKVAVPFAVFLYRNYFRVETLGVKNVPAGRVFLISNHSGQIPLDGMMIISAMILEAQPPRMVRSMVETWVPTLPLISYFFARTGQIVGTRENCLKLIEREEAILAFPEGVKGISKTFGQRYQLADFGLGFMRLCLMTNTPVVPVAVIGAEEQVPSLFNLKPLAKLLGFPAFPITPTFPWLGPFGLIPLPSKYRIYFGEPMRFEGDPNDEDSVIAEKVKKVRITIQRMIHQGLKERKNVFW